MSCRSAGEILCIILPSGYKLGAIASSCDYIAVNLMLSDLFCSEAHAGQVVICVGVCAQALLVNLSGQPCIQADRQGDPLHEPPER